MSLTALAYKKHLTLDEAALLMLDGGKGIGGMWSLLREAVENGSLDTVKLVRHTRYDGNMGCEVYDPTGHADVHQTTVERTKLVEWLTAINYQPKPKLLFPESEPVKRECSEDKSKLEEPLLPIPATAPKACDSIDWNYWRHMSEVKIWQAVFLSFGIDPDKHDPDYCDFDDFIADNPAISKRLKLLTNNRHRAEFFSRGIVVSLGDANLGGVQLPEFAAWGLYVGFEMPIQLVKMAALSKGYEYQAREKQKAGRYTIEAAANELAEKTGWRKDRWLGLIKEHVINGGLPLKNPRDWTEPLPYAIPDKIRDFYDEVSKDDVNKWLRMHPEWGMHFCLGDDAAVFDVSQVEPSRRQMQHGSLIVRVAGRDALPVRAIPYVAGWKNMSPDYVAKLFAKHFSDESSWAGLRNTFAFHLQSGTPVRMLPKEWDSIVAILAGLEADLRNKFPDYNQGYAVWQNEAALKLPAGVFVWRDEFEKDFHDDFSPEVLSFRKERPGERDLIYAPMLSGDVREIVFDGFITRHVHDALPGAQPQGSTEQVLLDPIPFAQAYEILHKHFGATEAETAMWICLGHLSAWRTKKQRFQESDLDRRPSASLAAKRLKTLNVLLSKSEVEAFKLNSVERFVNYEVAARLIKNAARDATDEAELLEEWRDIHSKNSSTKLEDRLYGVPQIAAFVPGSGWAKKIEDGLVMKSQINIWLESHRG